MMEPASKRRKVALPPIDAEEDDELGLEPDELNERRDPAFQLAQGRAKAAKTLKSRFEDIFARYGKDFTGIGDEIDLSTGKVVVDNGHLSSLKDMDDWIVDDEEDDDNEDDDDDQDGAEAEEAQANALRAANATETGSNERDDAAPKDPWHIPSLVPEYVLEPNSLLESLRSHQADTSHRNGPDLPTTHELSVSVDPAWQAPELPPSAFICNTFSSPAGCKGKHYGSGTPVATKTVVRSSLPAPNSSEADEVDDLQAIPVIPDEMPSTNHVVQPGNGRLDKNSPLIRKKFPSLGSSPQDHSLVDLIQDVIENIPDTPPSIRRKRPAKSLGKPSPLGIGTGSQRGAKSTLRTSHTASGAPAKRGRTPKIRAQSIIEEEALGGPSDLSSWDSTDLESYVDVTDLDLRAIGRPIYIDIRASSVTKKGTAVSQKRPLSQTQVVQSATAIADTRIHEKVIVQRTRPVGVEVASQDTPNQVASIATAAEQPKKAGKLKVQAIFTRNVADPDFYFSDDETLLPKRRSKKKRPTGPPKPTTTPQSKAAELVHSTSNNVKQRVWSAAEARRAVLDREKAAGLLQQHSDLATEPAKGSPVDDLMQFDPSLRLLETSDAIPDWIQECIPDQPPMPERCSNPGNAVPENPPSASYDQVESSASKSLGGEDLDSASGHTDVGAFDDMAAEPIASVENEQTNFEIRHELSVDEAWPDLRTRHIEADLSAVQVQMETVATTAENCTVAVAEKETVKTSEKSKKQRRSSERLTSKPQLVTETTVPWGKVIVPDKGAEEKLDTDTHHTSNVVESSTAHHSLGQLTRRPRRGRPSRAPLSVEQVDLSTQQDLDLGSEQILPEQETDQSIAEPSVDISPAAQSADSVAMELHNSHTEQADAVNLTGPVEDARTIGPENPSLWQTPPRRRSSARSLVLQPIQPITTVGRKRRAQEASLDAEGSDDEASQAPLSHQPIENEQPAHFSSPALPEPSPRLAREVPQPTTPRRPTSKATQKTPASSANRIRLISLLSDSDDSEDEISFNNSDFTPSGNHRILVHRRLSQLSTTTKPRFSASSSSSSSKKKKRPSLLYGMSAKRTRSSTRYRVSQTPRSTAAAPSQGEGSTGKQRRKHQRLPHSAVRGVRRRDSDVERESSVVQTPGGTKRRCGVDGWKCDRDFCFTCM